MEASIILAPSTSLTLRPSDPAQGFSAPSQFSRWLPICKSEPNIFFYCQSKSVIESLCGLAVSSMTFFQSETKYIIRKNTNFRNKTRVNSDNKFIAEELPKNSNSHRPQRVLRVSEHNRLPTLPDPFQLTDCVQRSFSLSHIASLIPLTVTFALRAHCRRFNAVQVSLIIHFIAQQTKTNTNRSHNRKKKKRKLYWRRNDCHSIGQST